MHGVSDARQTDTHTAEPPVPETSVSEFVLVIGKIKVTTHPLLIISYQNWLKKGVRLLVVRFLYLLFPFRVRSNFFRSGKDLSLYLSIRRAIKQNVVIIVDITFSSYIQNFNLHSAVKINSICRGIYWGSSVRIWTQQTNKWAYIVHCEILEIWLYIEAEHQLFIDFVKAYDFLGGKSCVIILFSHLSQFNWWV